MKKLFLYLLIIILYFAYSCKRDIGMETRNNLDKNHLLKVINKDTQIFSKVKAPLGEIIESLPTYENLIALTFDACEYKKASYFDTTVLNYLIKEKIPVTIFVSGKFAVRNSEKLKCISQYDFIEIENHSLNHNNHTEKLTIKELENEVLENDRIIKEITGRNTKFFRFPAGNYNNKSLEVLKNLKYPVIHWTFVSGDYDKHMTPQKLYNKVISKISSGCILIFHINGRGYGTREALPYIIDYIRNNNYRIVKLEDVFE